MTQLGEAYVPIRATLDKLEGDLAEAKSKISGVVSGLATVGKAAVTAGITVATTAITGLGLALGFSLTQAMANEQQQASLAAVIASTGNAANLTLEEVNDLASGFTDLGQGSDDAALGIIEIGLRAQTVAKEDFPDFIQASFDLGAVMGDTAAAATLLARAQDDPVAAMGRLQRSGILFSESLQQQIKDMTEAGDVAGAAALIMDRVAEATGGQAQAQAETLAGKWAILKGRLGEAAEAIGTKLLPFLTDLFERVIAPNIPVVETIADLIGEFFDRIAAGFSVAQALPALVTEIGLALGLTGEQAADLGQRVSDVIQWFTDLGLKIQEIVAAVQPYLETAAEWITQNVKLQDVLIALGVAIAAFVIPAIASVVAAAAPIVAIFLGVIAVALLLRTAWEENWGGIQEKTAAVWAAVQPLLAQAREWLEVNIPVALEALRTFWVDTAWPAIQKAVEVVWPIIQAIFNAYVFYVENIFIPTVKNLWTQWTTVWWPAIQQAIADFWAFAEPILADAKDFILNTLIPAVVDLWTKWTTEWWPDIETALTNAWTIIEGVFEEVDRWVNTNIIPWINELKRVWAEDVWPIIQKAVEDFWAIVGPIWEDLKEWLGETLPPIIESLRESFATNMAQIQENVQPVKDLWDALVKAVSDFWNWITSHTFNFSISIPDLPDWAVPGSPLPIHTAWKAFAADMGRMTIAPRVDLGQLLPVAALVQDGGADRSVHMQNQTTIVSSGDPMRAVRASRHLDALGSLA